MTSCLARYDTELKLWL